MTDVTNLVALHGIGAGAPFFQPLFEELGGGVAYSMPGYDGRAVKQDLTFAGLCDDLRAFLDRQGIEKADLFGHSLGGMIALDFALRFPDRMRALIACCTTPVFGSRDGSFQEAFLKARLEPLKAGKTMAELAVEAIAPMVGPGAADGTVEAGEAMMAALPPDAFEASIRVIVTFNRRADLGSVAVPTLILSGTNDINAPAKTMAKMADAIPGARYAETDAGHFLPLERPRETADILRDFLAELDKVGNA